MREKYRKISMCIAVFIMLSMSMVCFCNIGKSDNIVFEKNSYTAHLGNTIDIKTLLPFNRLNTTTNYIDYGHFYTQEQIDQSFVYRDWNYTSTQLSYMTDFNNNTGINVTHYGQPYIFPKPFKNNPSVNGHFELKINKCN